MREFIFFLFASLALFGGHGTQDGVDGQRDLGDAYLDAPVPRDLLPVLNDVADAVCLYL